MKQFNVVILAAGKGERMVSRRPKVMHEIMGKPMVGFVIEAAKELLPQAIVCVLGHGQDQVEPYVKTRSIQYSTQREQRGTAHAVLTAEPFLKAGNLLVLYGDVPLVEPSTLKDFLSFSEQAGGIVFLTTNVENPSGYGRVITSGDEIVEIVEHADATEEQKNIHTINTGICLIPAHCFSFLKMIKPENRKGEYYLTDICKVAKTEGVMVKAFHHPNAAEVLGINTKRELLDANMTMRYRILNRHMDRGVIFLDRNVYVDENVKIGMDTTIYPNVHLTGDTVIGENVVIEANVIIRSCRIKDNVRVESFVVMEGTEIEGGTTVSPFPALQQPPDPGRA